MYVRSLHMTCVCYLWKEVAKELVYVWCTERLSKVHQHGVYIVNERRIIAQHLYVTLIHLFRLVDLIPRSTKKPLSVRLRFIAGSFKVRLFIELRCPSDLGQDLGTFMISRPN